MISSRRLFFAASVALLLIHFVEPAASAQSNRFESVIVSLPKPYARLLSEIQNLGGRIRHEYQYVDAVALDIPVTALPALRNLVGDDAVSKDVTIAAPRPASAGRRANPANLGIYLSVAVGGASRVFPASVPHAGAYLLNHADTGIRSLHAAGRTGSGVIVAVIDSGVRPGYPALDLDGSIVGGENFVPDPVTGVVNPSDFRNPNHDPHGTFVAALVSGNAKFEINGALRESLNRHLPAVLNGASSLPLAGTAPLSSIYVIRVFGADAQQGAPKSRVLAAIERVIELRERYERRRSGGVNIQVVNLSLGTSTIFAGHTEMERFIRLETGAGRGIDGGIWPAPEAGHSMVQL
ncbi:MAG: S8 family serine peptidase, partial [Acidobacteria bacterium]|nr:S8 family serine peptidase [Acidobacteriota bacterium]